MRLLRMIIPPLLSLIIACSAPAPETIPVPVTDGYLSEIEAWHSKRNASLSKPDSWLALAGLFWLQEGDNHFGSDPENDLVFPGDGVPARMGILHLKADSVTLKPLTEIQYDSSIVGEIGLDKDISGAPTVLEWGSLSWYAIQRGDRIGIRLKDSQHPNLIDFKGTELFPVEPSWRIPAELIPVDSGTTIDIINVLGDTTPNRVPGILEFSIEGQKYRLTPLADPGDKKWFIIFGDATNGIETYGAGRFLVIPAADENGRTLIDFNRSCAFSPYATCPLPPEENILSVEIRAGEKNYEYTMGH